MTLRSSAMCLLLACVLTPAAAAASSGSAETMFERTLQREQLLRDDAGADPTLAEFRRVVSAYDALVRRFPRSGYCDNALWQGGNLALLAFQRFGDERDRRTAERLLTWLKEQYPTSSLRKRVDSVLQTVGEATTQAAGLTKSDADASEKPVGTSALSSDRGGAAAGALQAPAQPEAGVQIAPILIRDIKRTAISDGMRVTIEMDAETSFRAERLDNPRRVFFDLKGTRPVPSLLDATLRFSDEIVREIRLGRHPQSTTRIVFDMDGVDTYSVFTLYSPYRLVIDFKPQVSGVHAAAIRNAAPIGKSAARTPLAELKRSDVDPRVMKNSEPEVPSLQVTALTSAAAARLALEPAPEPPATSAPDPIKPAPVTRSPLTPAVPAANLDGKFSLARQLGLGISRVVIDAGHGGHDPGAQANGVSESELTLDVAARLGRLLQKQPGVEVVMTRESDVFVPLEERTAIANREGADLFLSIHANASRDARVRGVETYFLNFASNPAAEAVAARENSASSRAMHSLPDIVRAIALNNKLDESRDFAEMVQRSMVHKLTPRNKQLRDLGVKQAPFVVLIGASMPSVLAEISFLTHKQEGQLLKSSVYRQQIAEALFDAVLKYQESLKRPRSGVVGLGAR